MVSKLSLWEMGTGQHVFTPSPAYRGNQSLRERPVPGLSEWKVPGETPKACVPFLLLSPSPWTNPSSFNTTLWRVLSSIGGATPRKEGGGGNPVTRRLRAQGAFQSSSGPAAPTSFGCIRQSFASGGPMSSPLSPKTISSWAPGLPRLQG